MWGAPIPLVASPGGPPQLYDPICDDLVSDAANHDVVWVGDYRAVLVSIDLLVPATNNTFLRMLTSSDGGSTFDSGASDYRFEVSTTANVQRFSQVAAAAYIQISGPTSGLSNAADLGLNFDLTLAQPLDGKRTILHGQGGYWPNEGVVTSAILYGLRLAAGRVDGLRFFMSVGNISTARIRARGVLPNGEGA